jgi:hypothetical protein
MKTENKEIMINIRVNEKLRNDYKEYCKTNGYSLSKRIRILLENDIMNKIKIK